MKARSVKILAERGRSLVAAVICGALALLLTVAMLSLSARAGRMAMPIAYDDVVYAFNGFAIYRFLVEGETLIALLQLLHEHAPLQSALSVLSHFVFGFHEWGFTRSTGCSCWRSSPRCCEAWWLTEYNYEAQSIKNGCKGCQEH